MISSFAFLPALAYFVNDFDPEILHIWGPLAIRWYGVAYVCGFIAGGLVWRKAIKDGLVSMKWEDMESVFTWVIAGVLVGGRLGYMLFYDFGGLLADPLSIIRVDQGGMAFHGGMLGVVIAMAIVARRRKLSFLGIADMCAMAAPFGLFFGRMANFVNGELWGHITSVPWAMVFPKSGYLPTEPTVYYESAFGSGLANPRHPSQLYEALLEGVLLGAVMLVLFWFRKGIIPKKAPGFVGGVFIVFYAAFRIFCELFREPDAGLILGVSRGTFYSLLMALAGAGAVIFITLRTLSTMKKENLAGNDANAVFKAAKARFDKGAATWDENSERKARSNAIAAEYGRIIDALPQKPELFDYGCGTGQSILPVAGKCARVVGGDFSEGMLGKFTENAKSLGLDNAGTLCCDLASQTAPDARFDMITSSMTLHHIADIPAILGKFATMLRSGGVIALVDLETEDGSFHGNEEGVAHKGFDKAAFARMMEAAGFDDVAVKTIYHMRKEEAGREFPLFLATGRRK